MKTRKDEEKHLVSLIFLYVLCNRLAKNTILFNFNFYDTIING